MVNSPVLRARFMLMAAKRYDSNIFINSTAYEDVLVLQGGASAEVSVRPHAPWQAKMRR